MKIITSLSLFGLLLFHQIDLSYQQAPLCVLLSGSTACPAFSDQYISPQGLLYAFDFLENVNDTASFDAGLLSYVYGSFPAVKYGQEFGCPDFDPATEYARWSLTWLCAAFTQNDQSLDCNQAFEVSPRKLCAETCTEFAYSEAQIVSNNAICGPDHSGGSRQYWLNQDNSTCTNWTSLATQDPNSGSCILGSQNEGGCGFGSDAVSLCSYCDPSSNLNADPCCYSNSTNLGSCHYDEPLAAASVTSSVPVVSSSANAAQRSALSAAQASILVSGFSAISVAYAEYASTAGGSIISGIFGTTTLSSSTLVTSAISMPTALTTSLLSTSSTQAVLPAGVSTGTSVTAQSTASSTTPVGATLANANGSVSSSSSSRLSGKEIIGLAIGCVALAALALIALACICTCRRRRRRHYAKDDHQHAIVESERRLMDRASQATLPYPDLPQTSNLGNPVVPRGPSRMSSFEPPMMFAQNPDYPVMHQPMMQRPHQAPLIPVVRQDQPGLQHPQTAFINDQRSTGDHLSRLEQRPHLQYGDHASRPPTSHVNGRRRSASDLARHYYADADSLGYAVPARRASRVDNFGPIPAMPTPYVSRPTPSARPVSAYLPTLRPMSPTFSNPEHWSSRVYHPANTATRHSTVASEAMEQVPSRRGSLRPLDPITIPSHSSAAVATHQRIYQPAVHSSVSQPYAVPTQYIISMPAHHSPTRVPNSFGYLRPSSPVLSLAGSQVARNSQIDADSYSIAAQANQAPYQTFVPTHSTAAHASSFAGPESVVSGPQVAINPVVPPGYSVQSNQPMERHIAHSSHPLPSIPVQQKQPATEILAAPTEFSQMVKSRDENVATIPLQTHGQVEPVHPKSLPSSERMGKGQFSQPRGVSVQPAQPREQDGYSHLQLGPDANQESTEPIGMPRAEMDNPQRSLAGQKVQAARRQQEPLTAAKDFPPPQSPNREGAKKKSNRRRRTASRQSAIRGDALAAHATPKVPIRSTNNYIDPENNPDGGPVQEIDRTGQPFGMPEAEHVSSSNQLPSQESGIGISAAPVENDTTQVELQTAQQPQPLARSAPQVESSSQRPAEAQPVVPMQHKTDPPQFEDSPEHKDHAGLTTTIQPTLASTATQPIQSVNDLNQGNQITQLSERESTTPKTRIARLFSKKEPVPEPAHEKSSNPPGSQVQITEPITKSQLIENPKAALSPVASVRQHDVNGQKTSTALEVSRQFQNDSPVETSTKEPAASAKASPARNRGIFAQLKSSLKAAGVRQGSERVERMASATSTPVSRPRSRRPSNEQERPKLSRQATRSSIGGRPSSISGVKIVPSAPTTRPGSTVGSKLKPDSGSNVITSFQDRFSEHSITAQSTVIVVHSYTSRLADELNLQPGAEVIVRKLYDDGWGVGSIEEPIGSAKWRDGAFPLVCVTSKLGLSNEEIAGAIAEQNEQLEKTYIARAQYVTPPSSFTGPVSNGGWSAGSIDYKGKARSAF